MQSIDKHGTATHFSFGLFNQPMTRKDFIKKWADAIGWSEKRTALFVASRMKPSTTEAFCIFDDRLERLMKDPRCPYENFRHAFFANLKVSCPSN